MRWINSEDDTLTKKKEEFHKNITFIIIYVLHNILHNILPRVNRECAVLFDAQ